MARTSQSLREIHEQYIRFRKEWELAHMTPFLRMLADRQAILRDQSVRFADRTGEPEGPPPTSSDCSSRRSNEFAACYRSFTKLIPDSRRVCPANSESAAMC